MPLVSQLIASQAHKCEIWDQLRYLQPSGARHLTFRTRHAPDGTLQKVRVLDRRRYSTLLATVHQRLISDPPPSGNLHSELVERQRLLGRFDE